MAGLREFLLKVGYSVEGDSILWEGTMGSVLLGGLVIYALVCMLIAMVVVIQNMDKLAEMAPPWTRYEVFLFALICLVLISPTWIPGTIVSSIRILWREAVSKCQSSEEDHQ